MPRGPIRSSLRDQGLRRNNLRIVICRLSHLLRTVALLRDWDIMPVMVHTYQAVALAVIQLGARDIQSRAGLVSPAFGRLDTCLFGRAENQNTKKEESKTPAGSSGLKAANAAPMRPTEHLASCCTTPSVGFLPVESGTC